MKITPIRGTKAALLTPTWFTSGYAGAMSQREDARLVGPADAYSRVPIVRRAVDLITEAVGSVPVRVHSARTGEPTEWPYGSLSDWAVQTERDLLIYGAAYWLKLRNRVRYVGLLRLHPTTVQIRVTRAEYPPEYEFLQMVNGEQFGPWPSDEVLHLWLPDPSGDIRPGQSPTSTALNAAQVLYYLERFAARYFEGDAMPVTLLQMGNMVGEAEVKRVESRFRRLMSGIKNAFRIIGTRADVKTETLTPPLNTMAVPELHEQARQAVAQAFGIPQTMLEDAANYATAREHRLSFWNDTIRPRVAVLEEKINEFASELGLVVHFDLDALDVFQEDENRRAAAFRLYTSAGVQPGLAMQMLGLELPEGWEYDPATGEPRRVRTGEAGQTGKAAADWRDDLRRWERKALRRAKAGKSPAAAFQSDLIPPALHAAISGALEGVKSQAAIKAVFRAAAERPSHVHTWGGYP